MRHIIIQMCLALNTAEVILRTLKALSSEGLSAIESCTPSAYQVLAKLASKGILLIKLVILSKKRCNIWQYLLS